MLEARLNRFISKVEFTDSCWLWLASRRARYGVFKLPGDERVKAHRWLWEVCNGPVPAGLELDHLCRNTRCVNPDHLEPVTHRVNTLRGNTIVAAHARKTHCPAGHPLSGDNLFYVGNPRRRQCRVCRYAANKRYYYRRQSQAN